MFKKNCWFHKWEEIKNTGKYSYRICTKCYKRKFVDLTPGSGYQPIQKGWEKK